MTFGRLDRFFVFVCLFLLFFVFWRFKGRVAIPQGHGNKGKKTKKAKSKNNTKEKKKPKGLVGRGPLDSKALLVPSHLSLDRTRASLSP